MEAIILAGGFGTRLKEKISHLPKAMAPINNKPFLDYLFYYLKNYGVRHIILSVFHKSEIIKRHYNDLYNGIIISYSNDKIPLGTGGALRASLRKSIDNNIIVINGDTYFNVDLYKMMNTHIINNNDITLSLKPMSNYSRYGSVVTENNGKVTQFIEKEYKENGNINGGIYIIKNTIFNQYKGDESFLFTQFIEDNLNLLKIGSILFDELFIDIGIPKDLEKAQKLLKNYL